MIDQPIFIREIKLGFIQGGRMCKFLWNFSVTKHFFQLTCRDMEYCYSHFGNSELVFTTCQYFETLILFFYSPFKCTSIELKCLLKINNLYCNHQFMSIMCIFLGLSYPFPPTKALLPVPVRQEIFVGYKFSWILRVPFPYKFDV